MIKCEDFYNILKKNGFIFFSGIPDSTFKEWTKFLDDNEAILQNIVSCNECEAIALIAGYYLATNKIGIVYMQNSGLGKAVNPLTSLCDPEVYSIPLLLMIGWRGEPGKSDAPQHKKMGKITLPLLETLKIPYCILEPNLEMIEKEFDRVNEYLNNNKGPYAFIFRHNFFQHYDFKKKKNQNKYELSRGEAINLIMDNLDNDEIIISSTGYLSREVFEYREMRKKDHFKSFYNIGSMGNASSIGLSIAIQKPDKRVIIFDGDGAAIMQLGAFTTIGKHSVSNLVHIVFDNHAHESTGGQPTNSSSVDFLKIALASSYKSGKSIITKEELLKAIPIIKKAEGPIIIIIKINIGSRCDLKRPDKDPKEYKEEFMKYLTRLK
ncbi:MAG: phosphonopyruvate decarboxylase [Promethearchaeota archaeon]